MAEERLVKSSSGSHWYTREGEPCYEVPYYDQKKYPGRMTPTKLNNARKLDLVPSVTTILRIIYKQQLEEWKQTQGMMAALTLPRLDGESDELFIRRLRDDAAAYAKESASLGTATHRAIERWMTHKEFSKITHGYDTGDMLSAFTGFWVTKFGDVKYQCEVPFACDAGYGGKVDIITDEYVIDIKTTGTKKLKGKKIIMYPEAGMQLAAYCRGLGYDKRIINVCISSDEPGRIEVVDWTDEREGLYKCFMDAFSVWKYLNKYDPTILQKGKDKKNDSGKGKKRKRDTK